MVLEKIKEFYFKIKSKRRPNTQDGENMLNDDFIKSVKYLSNLYRIGFEEYHYKKAGEACDRFNESYIRLKIRINDQHNALIQLLSYGGFENQLTYVDRIEAVHQQVYVVMSNFVLMLKKTAPKKISDQIPIRSLKKFLKLKWIQSKYINKELIEASHAIEISRSFRAKYIAHPQAHPVFDWATSSHGVEYFNRDEEVKVHKSNHRPIIQHPLGRTTTQSPSVDKTLEALKVLILEILSLMLRTKKWNFSQKYLQYRISSR